MKREAELQNFHSGHFFQSEVNFRLVQAPKLHGKFGKMKIWKIWKNENLKIWKVDYGVGNSPELIWKHFENLKILFFGNLKILKILFLADADADAKIPVPDRYCATNIKKGVAQYRTGRYLTRFVRDSERFCTEELHFSDKKHGFESHFWNSKTSKLVRGRKIWGQK